MSFYPKLSDSLYLSSDDEVNNSEGFELDGGSGNLGRQELLNRETRVRHEQKKTPRVLSLQVAPGIIPSHLKTLSRSTWAGDTTLKEETISRLWPAEDILGREVTNRMRLG